MKIETNEMTIDQLDLVRGAGVLREVRASQVRFRFVVKLQAGTPASGDLNSGPVGGTGGGSTGGCPGQPTHH